MVFSITSSSRNNNYSAAETKAEVWHESRMIMFKTNVLQCVIRQMCCSYDRNFKLTPMTHKEDSENNYVIQAFSFAEIYVTSGGNQKNNYRMSVLHEKHDDNPNNNHNNKKREYVLPR
jgi:thioredoxin-related protein